MASTTTRKRKTKATTPSKPRKKKLRLTQQELSLLEYPPTEKTWLCPCGMFGTGSMELCWACRTPNTGDLLWPKYLAVCKKVGIEPGTLWKITDKRIGIASIRTPGKSKWIEFDLPEGYTL